MGYMKSKVLFKPGFFVAQCGRESDMHRKFVSGVLSISFMYRSVQRVRNIYAVID